VAGVRRAPAQRCVEPARAFGQIGAKNAWIQGIYWIDRGALAVTFAVALAACAAAPPAPPPPPVLVTVPAEEAPSLPTAEPAPPAPSVTAVAVAPPPSAPAPTAPYAVAYAIDELRLIGLIVGTKAPRALFVDPAGLGFVVAVGDPVGRPEALRPGDPSSFVTWRVAAIHARDLLLVRDDPAHPGVPQKRTVPLAKPKTP